MGLKENTRGLEHKGSGTMCYDSRLSDISRGFSWNFYNFAAKNLPFRV